MNWTEQIIARLAGWFNLTDPTPQEVHQAVESVADLDTLRDNIRKEITDAQSAQVAALTKEKEDANTALATANARIKVLETELDAAKARVKELEAIEGEHTKTKSTDDNGGKQTETPAMPIWDAFKSQLGL